MISKALLYFGVFLAFLSCCFIFYTISGGELGSLHVLDPSIQSEPTRIFEDKQRYDRENSKRGYFGPVTSIVNWCEDDYSISYYIAEFHNCVSNGVLLVVGIWGIYFTVKENFERRCTLAFVACVITSLGSFAFHAMLTRLSQNADELPMVMLLFVATFILIFVDPEFEDNHPWLEHDVEICFTAAYFLYCAVHIYLEFNLIFQSFFCALLILSAVLVIKEARRSDETGMMLGIKYIAFMIIGTGFWIADQAFCQEMQDFLMTLAPKSKLVQTFTLHTFWHICSGLGAFYGSLFFCYHRSLMLKEEPAIKTSGFLHLPYVDRQAKGIGHHRVRRPEIRARKKNSKLHHHSHPMSPHFKKH